MQHSRPRPSRNLRLASGSGVHARKRIKVSPRRVSQSLDDQTAALRLPRRCRTIPAMPRMLTPRSDKVAGSGAGIGVVFTPSRNTVGGSLTVLPALPQAKNVSTIFPALGPLEMKSDAVGVNVISTLFQSVIPCDGVFMRVESSSIL